MIGIDLDPSILAFPANIESGQIAARVATLAAWSQFCALNKWFSLSLSTTAKHRLRESGHLPAHLPVTDALKACAMQQYSPGDVIRLIYSILDTAIQHAHCCVRDELHSGLTSDPDKPWHQHHSLDALTEQALVIGHIERHIHSDERLRTVLSFVKGRMLRFQAQVDIVEPSHLTGFSAPELPKEIRDEVVIVQEIEQFLSTLNAEKVWAGATTASDLKLAIALKCREQLRNTNEYRGMQNLPSFYVGEEFQASLRGRECDGEQKYAGQTLDSCAAAVLSLPTLEIKDFDKSKRKADGALPLRAHINKGGAAMRLMMWKRPEAKGHAAIEFANVGRKHEEEICYSDPLKAV